MLRAQLNKGGKAKLSFVESRFTVSNIPKFPQSGGQRTSRSSYMSEVNYQKILGSYGDPARKKHSHRREKV